MEFALEYHGNIHRDFDRMPFPEFVALYDKLVKQKRIEKQESEGGSKTISVHDMIRGMNTGQEE